MWCAVVLVAQPHMFFSVPKWCICILLLYCILVFWCCVPPNLCGWERLRSSSMYAFMYSSYVFLSNSLSNFSYFIFYFLFFHFPLFSAHFSVMYFSFTLSLVIKTKNKYTALLSNSVFFSAWICGIIVTSTTLYIHIYTRVYSSILQLIDYKMPISYTYLNEFI